MKQDDQRADATQADAANRRADANRADAVADERNFDDAVEAVVKRLEANRANTLALVRRALPSARRACPIARPRRSSASVPS